MITFINLEERNRIADALRRNQAPLGAASIDEAVDGKISYADLEKGLTIRFPFTEGMREGGRYHVKISAEDRLQGFGQLGTIPEEDKDTTVEVPADRALAFRGQQIELSWDYLEYPPEEGASPVTQLSVEGLIYKPLVDEAVGGVIPSSALSQGVNLRIRAASSLTPGALVSIYWWGSSADACFVKHLVIGPGPIEDLVLPVGPVYLTPTKNGKVRVIYTVQSTTATLTSPLLGLTVGGDLAVPEGVYVQRPEVRSGALLPPITESGRIPMRLKTQGMVPGDVAILFFVGSFLGTEFVLRHEVKPSDIAAGQIALGVPASYSSLGPDVWAWSMVHRLAGGAGGSPDLLLSLIQE